VQLIFHCRSFKDYIFEIAENILHSTMSFNAIKHIRRYKGIDGLGFKAFNGQPTIYREQPLCLISYIVIRTSLIYKNKKENSFTIHFAEVFSCKSFPIFQESLFMFYFFHAFSYNLNHLLIFFFVKQETDSNLFQTIRQ